MDFSEAKSLYVGNTPVEYAWLNGRRVWPQGVGNDEVGLLLTDGTYVPYAEVVKGTRAIGKDEVVGITFNDELNSFIMAPENVGPFYFCGATILPELPEGMPPDNLTGPQVVTNENYRHGKEYTDILYPYLSGAPEWAVPQAKNYVFKDGTPGYLGSPYEYKQIQRHYEEINEMAAKVGLDELFPGDFSHRYWTSVLSEFHGDTRWVWIWSGPSYVDGGNGQGMFHIRPLGEFSKPTVEQSIRDAMILWYDISRQGATNEGMAANPVLRDLSGNGHDATCYNFAWSGMSGIGGYNMSSNDWSKYSNMIYNIPNFTTIHITKVRPLNNDLLIAWISEHGNADIQAGTEFTLPPIRYKVTGTQLNELRAYVRGDTNGYSQVISSGVEYYFEGGTFTKTDYSANCGFEIGWISVDKTERDVDITVELLPLYPNALVSDGVDDYAAVEGLPLLNKERGFTVLAKRKWISDINSRSQGFATKGTSLGWIDGAFYFECVEGNGSAPFNRVFDNSNGQRGVNYISNFTENDITYLTSKEYNGSPLNNIGDAVDTDGLQLFKLAFNNTTTLSSIALYSFILFDRDLSDDEIEWVKTNLIGGENQ